ncbi:hypothetical protein PSHT_07082, partial [Puccinia striiformis]
SPQEAELLATDHVVNEAIETGCDCKLTFSLYFSSNPLSTSLFYFLRKTLNKDDGFSATKS